ncbi:hypothetical protein [Hymenobacter metallicola]|uniref:hypothetical protein n=1 Tax=Hymenobacter metallicola TaxID=2563114 RepID=UPI0014368C72|nr:hypothetical protein [Hymenobacter metallicola]
MAEFIAYNDAPRLVTRAELRRAVTHPDRKAHNWQHYRDQLRALGIQLGRPKTRK